MYPYKEGDIYYTIENNDVVESVWDCVSEEIYDYNLEPGKKYFDTREEAINYYLKTKNNMRNKQNWASFIQECYKLKSFHGQKLRDKHKVDSRLLYTLANQGLVVKTENKGIYNWIYKGSADEELISTMIRIHTEFIRDYHKTRRNIQKIDKLSHKEEPRITEEQAVATLLAIGGYEIYKVERKLLK